MTQNLLKTLSASAAILFVFAASPSEVAPVVDAQGYFIEAGSGATEASISRSVSDARASGGALSVVVLAEEPPGGATTYSGAVLTELAVASGTVFTVNPETIGAESVDDIWSAEQIDAALDSALDGDTADEIVTLFVESLTGAAASGGGGGWIFLLLIAIVIGGIIVLIWRSSRAANARTSRAIGEAKAGVQAQIDAIANDILELEDEIAEAGPGAASDHFHEGTRSFSTAGDRLAAAQTGQAVLDLSFDLDVTIWKLDCAEALLDGREPPPEPVKPTPLVAPEPEPTPAETDPVGSGLPDELPEYHRRGARQSSYGSDEMMQTLLAMQAMKGLGGFGGQAGGTPRGTKSTPSGKRIRGGRRRRG